MSRKIVKGVAIALASIVAAMIAIVLIYVIYVAAQYNRIEDHLALEIDNNATEQVRVGQEYSILTYNIGFGAYDHDFSFFMDSGKMQDGTAVTGKDGKAKSEQIVLDNTTGAMQTAKQANADFYFFQEVDTDATRSYHVDQYAMLTDCLGDRYGRSFAVNFHSAYLFYPFHDPHGKSVAGLATYSAYRLESGERRQYPLDTGFAKFFDLDRCFSVYRAQVADGKQLVLINSHMSAYDEGGTIRQQQLEMLNAVLRAEAQAGNYVIVGGDFNHDIAASDGLYPTEQLRPEWVFTLTDDDLADGFRFAAATNAPTCRSTDMPYRKGVNYSVVLDGFIVSDNIRVVSNDNIDTDFRYSDHNPARMVFQLL